MLITAFDVVATVTILQRLPFSPIPLEPAATKKFVPGVI